jgi:hypothetical protein
MVYYNGHNYFGNIIDKDGVTVSMGENQGGFVYGSLRVMYVEQKVYQEGIAPDLVTVALVSE